jgi:WD40 repeat protein
VLSASADGTVRLWQLAGPSELRRLPTGGKRAWAAVFTHNDSHVLTCGDDPILRLYDTNPGPIRLIRPLPGHTATVNWVACRPRAPNQGLSAGHDKLLRLWNLDNGQKIRDYLGHNGPVHTCDFTPDGNRIVSGCGDGKVRLFDTNSGKLLHAFDAHKGAVWVVAASPDGRRALSGGPDAQIHLWDLLRGRKEMSFPGHARAVPGLAFSPDGRHFVSVSHDGTLRIWGVPPYKP